MLIYKNVSWKTTKGVKAGLMKGIKTFLKNKKNIVAKDIVTFLKKKEKESKYMVAIDTKIFLKMSVSEVLEKYYKTWNNG